MVMVVNQGPTPTVPQQSPKIHPQTPQLQMNTAGIPVYPFDALTIQALLSQAKSISGEDTYGIAQESHSGGVSV